MADHEYNMPRPNEGRTEPPVFLTEVQLAERWQVSRKFIQKKRYDGTGVPPIRFGRLVRYRLEEVVAYEEACRRASWLEDPDGQ